MGGGGGSSTNAVLQMMAHGRAETPRSNTLRCPHNNMLEDVILVVNSSMSMYVSGGKPNLKQKQPNAVDDQCVRKTNPPRSKKAGFGEIVECVSRSALFKNSYSRRVEAGYIVSVAPQRRSKRVFF